MPMSTIDTVLVEWMQALRNEDIAPNTIRTYGSSIRRFLTWYASQRQRCIDLTDLTPSELVTYRNSLQHSDTTNTVNTHISALRNWCAWLTNRGYLINNPATRLKFVERQALRVSKGLTSNQINALLHEAAHSRHPKRDTALVQMLLQTGMRIDECAVPTVRDVIFVENRGAVQIRSVKGNKARIVPLNSSVRQALADYKAPFLGVEVTPKSIAVAWPHSLDNNTEPLWLSQKGGRLTTSAISRVISNLVTAAAARGLIPIDTTPHTLRHTFAHSYLAKHPRDIEGLAALLGHSSLETTRNYTRPADYQIAGSVEHLDLRLT